MMIKKRMLFWGMIGCLAIGCAGCGRNERLEPTTRVYLEGTGTAAKETEITMETVTSKESEAAAKEIEEVKETKAVAVETNVAVPEESSEEMFIDSIVANAILEENADRYLGGECRGEGHIILEEVEEDGISTVYALMMYGEYEFQNVDYFIKTSGTGVIPVVMQFDLRLSSHTPLISFEWPMDGSLYNESIKVMFPDHLWNRVLSIRDEDRAVLEEMEHGYAERYLNEIGRDAVIGDYGDVANRTFLTDYGIRVEVSNKMLVNQKLMGPYPSWHGTREKVENGVRYIYSVFYEEETNQIIYEKRVFDTMETVEKFVYDASTGEAIEQIPQMKNP